MAVLLGGVLVTAWSHNARADLKENPYQVIIDRNPFALRPIPPPPPPPDNTPPPPPPMEIKITGLTTLLGPPKVFLEFTDPQTKKVDRPSPMSEGDSYKDNISIVSIDTDNERVKIRVGETESWIDFDKNGIKPAGTAAATPVPPAPGFGLPANPIIPPAPGGVAAPAASGPARGSLVGGATASASPVGGNPNPYAGGIPSPATSSPRMR